MKSRKRNWLMVLLLCLCMTLGMLPVTGTAFAAGLPELQKDQQTKETSESIKTVQTLALLADEIAIQTIEPGGTAELPAEMTGTVDRMENTAFPVTWSCEAFDTNTPGEYIFTAKLTEGYALAEGAVLPTIAVTVAEKQPTTKFIPAINGMDEAIARQTAPSFVPYGMVNNTQYTIDAPTDWDGLQTWLNSTAVNNAVVKINTAGAANQTITIPNKNITIESTVDSVENLRLVSNGAVTLTIKNLKFSAADANGAIELGTGSTLRFEGTNTLTVTNQYAPAIHVPENKSLTLAGVDASASLTVTASDHGAGIGGGGSGTGGGGAGGEVDITGGAVTVVANFGAGIGGYGATEGGNGGSVEISGASTKVNITQTWSGAGIGGGASNGTGGTGGSVNIKSGKVTISANHGAGIGGGFGSNQGGTGGTVEISGAATSVEITIANDGFGAGIGGGGSNQMGGAGGDVRIENGKVTINAVGGAGIGGGMGVSALGGDGGTVEISGAATVVEITMAEDGWGAGIGGGGSNQTGGAGMSVTIMDSTVTAYANWGADIGGGYGLSAGGAGGSLTINSTGRNRAVLDLQKKGTNAAPDHSIGTCQIEDATGTLTGFYSRLDVKNGTASYTDTQKDYWKQGIVKSGVTVSVIANTPQQNQYFVGWTATPALTFADPMALTISFTMPETAQEVTAQATPIISGSQTMTVAYGYKATSTGAFTISGGPEPIVTIDEDYDGKITWNDSDKKLNIAEGLGVGTYPVKLTANNGVDPEATLTFTLTVKGTAPAVTGEQKMTVAYGYEATSTDAFTVTGSPEPTVTIDKDYDGKILWNDNEKKLDIAAGLDVGTYPVKLTANNGVDPEATFTFTLTVEGEAPMISGQTAMTLTHGYKAASTSTFTITGNPVPTVTKTSGDPAITWNDNEKKLDIAEGLRVGVYPVTLTASSGVLPDATLTFTLTVEGEASAITGPTSMTLIQGYQAASTSAFTITGNPMPAVTKTSGDAAITWNEKDKTLDIAEGLEAGTYPVTLTASNGVDTDAVLTFTLTVLAPPTHEVIEGGNADVKPGKDYRVTFAGEYKNWKAVRLNGIEMGIIPQSDTLSYLTYPGYTGNAGQGEAGSVKITLYKEFLATLPAGVYKLEAEFEDGGVQTAGKAEFKLLEESKPKPTPTPDTNPGATKPANPTGVSPTDVSSTGDESNLWLWIAAMLVALVSIVALAFGRKHHK